jgi:formylglycine-generating enzyme required for sulfatase activity
VSKYNTDYTTSRPLEQLFAVTGLVYNTGRYSQKTGVTTMTETVRVIRVFLASPGDVPEERAQARHLIKDDLPALPFIKDKAWLKVVAWDDPTSRAPMPATLSPQRAIELGMTRPCECDIVVVVFWSRMGTPLDVERHGQKNGVRPYWSGTEWEYENALQTSETTGKPVVLVYRRLSGVSLNPEAPDFEERVEQLRRVKEFFAEFRDPTTGAWLRGYTEYETPEEFGELLKVDLLHYIQQLLEEKPTASETEPESVPKRPIWEGSPFPGLRAFTPDDAPIFFGRERETAALIKQLGEQRFVAVVGASGSGKSSLVGAGLIPRLLDNAIPGSKDWLWRRFTPGEVSDNPFAALAVQLAPLIGATPRDVADQLAADPGALCAICEQALAGQPDWAKLLLFIDQFEELFTTVKPEYRTPFVDLLTGAADTNRPQVVLTLRADFYHCCVEYPRLAELLREGSFPLAAPELDALLEMIERPAVVAGLTFEPGLPGRLLRDTGQEPGALALLAYTLDELYQRADDGQLTFGDYYALGGVQGAVGTRAEAVFSSLNQAAQDTLPNVFRELVEVDERGTATRQRSPLALFAGNDAAWTLLEKFTGARLLTTSDSSDGAVIEVAHEALFRNWLRLEDWIVMAQDDLRLLRQVRQAAHEWDNNDCKSAFLWPDERLKPVYDLLERLQPDLDRITQDFIRPEAERLLKELEDINTSHQQRSAIGERLCIIGDSRPGIGLRPDGFPNIVWCQVPRGRITLKDNAKSAFVIESFYIAKYPITYVQFQAFIDAQDGFQNNEWWQDLAADRDHKSEPGEQRFRFANYPRENVSWYDAVAFCRWLNARLPSSCWPEEISAFAAAETKQKGLKKVSDHNVHSAHWTICLPTEWEWQQAATGGNPANTYPWGRDWENGRCCNTEESGLSRTTAVGMYLPWASPIGAMDMAGNVQEWCLNEYNNIEKTDPKGDLPRVVRGGSWNYNMDYAHCVDRFRLNPVSRNSHFGFRVCVVSRPIP